MFLSYRNHGKRRYGKNPLYPHPRHQWEFQFFLEGECDWIRLQGRQRIVERVEAPALVVSGPESLHGWGGDDSDNCLCYIFHFDEAEDPVRFLIPPDGSRLVHFKQTEEPWIRSLYNRCTQAGSESSSIPCNPKKLQGSLEPLIHKIVASELSIFLLTNVSESEWEAPNNFAQLKVKKALAWYEANLSRGPNIPEVARAVQLSPTHLRRLFHKVRGMSPQEAFTRIQFDRAKWLMKSPLMTLEQIAENTGFGSASIFSRTFKARFGSSPRQFRNKE